ncbi:MAG: ferritin-like domain-containing protein [Myxococcales bacterium]|nr:ferritin-like domain-containing protein [Myxococcales bacterium]
MAKRRPISVLIAAAVPLGLVPACSPIGEQTEDACPTGSNIELAPVDGVDSVGLRFWSGEDAATPELLMQWGSPCGTATDQAACLATLESMPRDGSLRSDSGFEGPTFYDVVITRGDDVEVVVDAAVLKDVLGDIDTASEAGLYAFARGFDPVCGELSARQEDDGYAVLCRKGNSCGGDGVYRFELSVSGSGDLEEGASELYEAGDPNCAIGRRPAGLCSRPRRPRSLGQFFANAAHLEAASVPAFAQLAAELSAHGAPPALVRAAERARREEIRHAQVTAALARRFGAAPITPLLSPRGLRDLRAMALDNATEGCVRETFGAAIATVQARTARDASVLRAMRSIAADETRHAELSWAIDRWAMSRLTSSGRREMRRARRAAVEQLRAEMAKPVATAVRRFAGVPGPSESLRMLDALDASLWRSGG